MSLPIIPVLQAYGFTDEPQLWGRGSWRKVHCCFHPDRNASAQTDGIGFRCFTCSIFYPSAVALLMEREALSFESARSRAIELAGTGDLDVRGAPRAGSFLSGRTANRNVDGTFLSARRRGGTGGRA